MKRFDIGAAALCTLAAAALHFPHFASYIGDPNFDFFLHYNWAKEFAENIGHGAVYPRWIFHGRFGLGEPVFVFYSPLYYFAVAVFVKIGMSTWIAMHCVEIISNAIFGWFVYKTISYYADPRLALALGPVAILNPFLVMLHYKFQGFAWASVGYASHGMLLWSLFRPGASNRFLNVPAALAIALAVVGHTISALVNLICFSAACLVASRGTTQRGLRQIAYSAGSWATTVTFGIALSAFYLLPALHFFGIINSSVWGPSIVLGAFAWPVVTQFVYGMQWFSFQWLIPLPALLLVLLPAAYLLTTGSLRDSQARPIARALVIGMAAVFFASELSYALWIIDTPLLKIQLPYRFVSVAFVIGIVVSAAAIAHAARLGRRRWVYAMSAGLALTALMGCATLIKATYIDGTALPVEILQDEYTFRPFERKFLQSDYNGQCPSNDTACEQLSRAAGGFRGVPEYRLQWAGPDYLAYAKRGFAAECQANNVTCGVTARTSDGLEWSTVSQQTATLRLPVFHFPSWTVLLDGNLIDHDIDPATGLISVHLPTGRHEIRVSWKQTKVERYSLYLSLIAAVLLLGATIVRTFRSRSGELTRLP